MTDAPDPGLTDLIAAHDRLSQDILQEGLRYRCTCGWTQDVEWGNPSPFPAHVALVVEQHTNGRITELEAERDAALSKVTSVEMALERAHGDEIFTDDIWAALEGEQQ